VNRLSGWGKTEQKERAKKKRQKGKNDQRDGEGVGNEGGGGGGGEGEPVDKGLEPPFRPLVIDLSSFVCKM